MKNSEFRELDKRYVAPNYDPLPVVIERGHGVWVWDVEGNKYMDLVASYSALNHGHGHPGILWELRRQITRLSMNSRGIVSHNQTFLCPMTKKDGTCIMIIFIPRAVVRGERS